MLHKAMPGPARIAGSHGKKATVSLHSKSQITAKSLSPWSPALNKMNPGLFGILLSPGLDIYLWRMKTKSCIARFNILSWLDLQAAQRFAT